MEIPYKEWKDVLIRVNGEWKLKIDWANLIREHFKKSNPYCCPVFKRHNLNMKKSAVSKGKKVKGALFTANGRCKHQNCFQFSIRADHPSSTESPLIFAVKSEGDYCHVPGELLANQIRANEREKLKKKLKHRRAAEVWTSQNRNSNMNAVRRGNYTSAPDRQVLRQIRFEGLLKYELAKDVFEDLRLKFAMETEGSVDDMFIRSIELTNETKIQNGVQVNQKSFSVVYFSKRQLELMLEVKKRTGNLVLHFNSTGTLIRKVPAYAGTGRIYMYSIAINNPVPGNPPLPVLEFIMNAHTAKDICRPLDIFQSECRSILGLSKAEKLFTRMETDFSQALIQAVLKSFLGINTPKYLNECWKILFFDDEAFPMNFHVCRVHASKAIYDKAKELFGHQNSCVEGIKKILMGFWKSHEMASVDYRIQKLFILCGTEILSSEVNEIIGDLSARTPSNIKDDFGHLWESFDIAMATSSSSNKGTAFGAFFLQIWETFQSNQNTENSNGDSDRQGNPYYKIEFINYLLVHVLPYTPLLTHLMFESTGDLRKEDHQTAVENYNRIVKCDAHGRDGVLKLGIFISKAKKFTKGRCNGFEVDMLRNKRVNQSVRRGKHQDQEIFQKLDKNSRKSQMKRKNKIPQNPTKPSGLSRREYRADKKGTKSKEEEISNNECEEMWRRRGEKVAQSNGNLYYFNELPFIQWGTIVQENQCNFKFTNSCTLDNTLMAMFALHKWFPAVKNFVETGCQEGHEAAVSIRKVIGHVEKKEFNSAKAAWLMELSGRKLVNKSYGVNDLFGWEVDLALQSLRPLLQKYTMTIACREHGLKRQEICLFDVEGTWLHDKIRRINEELNLKPVDCSEECTSQVTRTITETSVGPLPFIILQAYEETLVSQVPRSIKALGTSYDLFCVSLNQTHRNHFISVYPLGRQWYTYDGLDSGFECGLPKEYARVGLVWYVKEM